MIVFHANQFLLVAKTGSAYVNFFDYLDDRVKMLFKRDSSIGADILKILFKVIEKLTKYLFLLF